MSRDGLRTHLLTAALFAVIATGLLAPMSSNALLPAAIDHRNHVAMIVQARMAIEEGQFPIRVGPFEHSGWRYPVYQFYSPFPYTVAAALYKWVSPWNPFIAYKLLLWSALWIGGFFTYLTSVRLTRSRPAAILAGVVYMTAPYLLVNVHARAAFTEAIAQGLLPMVVYASLRAYVGAWRSSWLFAAGIAWALLALTHNITYVYGGLFVGLFFVCLALRRWRVEPGLWRVGAAFALGVVLALFFVAPLVAADYLQIRYFKSIFRTTNLTPLPSLLSPVSLPSGYSTTANLNPTIGWPILFAVGCVLLTFRDLPRNVDGVPARRAAGILLALFGLTAFLAWSPFDIWTPLPRAVNMIQTTYRFLAYVGWTGALLSAFAFAPLFRAGVDLRHLLAGILLIVLAHSSFLPPFKVADISLDEVTRAPHIGYGYKAYLANVPSAAPERVMKEPDVRRFCLRSGQWWRCDLPVTERTVAQLPLLFYPEFLEVKVDGHDAPYLPIAFNDDYVLTGVALEPGVHIVEARFRGLPWANLTSAIAWVLTLSVFAVSLIARARRRGERATATVAVANDAA